MDAIVSSGTLEHVDNIIESMKEIRRVLKPGGWFFIFRFPAEYSISEYLAHKSGKWSHSIKMTKAELKFLMRTHSFRVEDIGYDSFLPIFLGGKLKNFRLIRSTFDQQINLLDSLLTSFPMVQDFSTSMYCFAQVNNEYEK